MGPAAWHQPVFQLQRQIYPAAPIDATLQEAASKLGPPKGLKLAQSAEIRAHTHHKTPEQSISAAQQPLPAAQISCLGQGVQAGAGSDC